MLASDYPARPIRLVVPYPPGASTNDILGRAIAARLTARLGQQVVVDVLSGQVQMFCTGLTALFAHTKADIAKYAPVVKAAGIKPD